MRIVLPFPVVPRGPNVSDVPRLTDEDKLYAILLGHVLRTVREAAGLTQAEVEDALHLSAQTIGRWERGKHAPKGYNFGRLFRFYEPYGAVLDDFLNPQPVVVVNPLRDRLATRPRREDVAAAQVRDLQHRAIEQASRSGRSPRTPAHPSPRESRRPSARAK